MEMETDETHFQIKTAKMLTIRPLKKYTTRKKKEAVFIS